MSESAPESIGQMIHFTRTGLSVHLDATEARVMRKGDELLLTEAVRQANTDRLGSCVFDLSASEQARRLGGQVYFLPGSAPEGSTGWSRVPRRRMRPGLLLTLRRICCLIRESVGPLLPRSGSVTGLLREPGAIPSLAMPAIGTAIVIEPGTPMSEPYKVTVDRYAALARDLGVAVQTETVVKSDPEASVFDGQHSPELVRVHPTLRAIDKYARMARSMGY